MKRYRIVAIDDAQEGMCLYGDLRDRAGSLLLPKSTLLSAATIKGLQRRGVEVVSIVDDTVTDQQLAAEREQAMARIAHLFRYAGTGSANALLRKAVEAYRMAELA
jgi:phosphatidylserine/phosphatidylglycerophosphate/cardiolipin synthase-like enzyme